MKVRRYGALKEGGSVGGRSKEREGECRKLLCPGTGLSRWCPYANMRATDWGGQVLRGQRSEARYEVNQLGKLEAD